MFAALPLATFLFLWRYYYLGRPGSDCAKLTHGATRAGSAGAAPGAIGARCWRTSFLYAALTCGVILVAGTELLSLVSAVSLGPLALLWGASAAVSGLLLYRRQAIAIPGAGFRLPKLSLLDALMLAVILLILLTTFVVAIVSPPNNWDSMVYHMARVAHWVQNGSVAFYPTGLAHQLYLSPLAEYGILHLYILWGGDRLANLAQWCCMAGCLAGISLIAARLGAGRRGQILAALICATIPMGILQASSTQNDYVIAFWLVCLAALALAGLQEEPQPRANRLAIGAALGLAVLTKATAYIYAAPLMLVYCVARLRRFAEWKEVRGLLLIGAMALLLNLGQYSRNARVFGSPLYGGGLPVTNTSWRPSLMASNVLRNIGLHCGAPWPSLNEAGARAIAEIHAALGIDPSDPRTTWQGVRFGPPGDWTHEDTAGNPLHLLLAVIAGCLIIGLRRLRSNVPLVIYMVCVVSGFLLFSFYLKWQPWNSRLQLPLFVLASAFAARALPEERLPWIAGLAALALTAYAMGPLLWNQSRPVAAQENIFNSDRLALQFRNRPYLAMPYRAAASYLNERNCRDIGLFMAGDDWEYPFWVLLDAPRPDLRIEHVGVNNPSARLDRGFGPAGPDAVICLTEQPLASLGVDSHRYVPGMGDGDQIGYRCFLTVAVRQ